MDRSRNEEFVCAVLPVVCDYARRAFAACNHELREECVEEALAAAFVSFVSLVKRRRAAKVTPGNLAFFAVKHVRNGRHVGGSRIARDAMTPRNGIQVTRFGHVSDLPQVLSDALTDNTRSPVPEQAAFRIDFPQFLAQESERKQEVAVLLAQGHQGKDVARSVGVSPGRVTQIRQELQKKWSATSK